MAKNVPVLVIHGGIGSAREEITPELEIETRKALEAALKTGFLILKDGGSSLDAVQAAVRSMEDNPVFNAGKGAALTSEGVAELDAAIMNGEDLKAGAIAGAKRIKNPVVGARAVMEKSSHVLLAGPGADAFGRKSGLVMVDPSYFVTPKRQEDLRQKIELEKKGKTALKQLRRFSLGTVGAVARDQKGHLAAATSTGGLTGKLPGRVGDTPIIGAGTYADDTVGAVSGTGHGEFFIRWSVARDILDLHRYRGVPIQAAANEVVQTKLKKVGGEGGVIVIDAKGNVAISFNTASMSRGYVDASGKYHVKLFKDEN